MTTVKLSFLFAFAAEPCPPNPPPPALVLLLLLDFERLNISRLLPRKQQKTGEEGSFVFPQAL
jgi:hypothetical protein